MFTSSACGLIAPTPYNSFPLDCILNPSYISSPQEEIAVEFPAQDCVNFLLHIENMLMLKLEDLGKLALTRDFLENLKSQIRNSLGFQTIYDKNIDISNSNKKLYLSVVMLKGPFNMLKNLVNALISGNLNPDAQVTFVALNLYESLKRIGLKIHDKSGINTRLKVGDMNVELNRLLSFEQLNGKKAFNIPRLLSNYGFYYKPSSITSTGIQPQVTNVYSHFCLDGHFSLQDIQDQPWRFLQGDMGQTLANGFQKNVYLASSINYMSQLNVKKPIFSDAFVSQEDNSVLLVTKTDHILICSTYTVLKCIGILDRKTGSFVTEEIFHKAILETQGSLNTNVRIKNAFLVPYAPKTSTSSSEVTTKWCDWCTKGMLIAIVKGPYSGTRGIVDEILDDQTISVLIEGLNEIVSLTIKDITPERPKLKSQALFIGGKHKGSIGTFISIHGEATVKMSSGEFVKTPIGTLAAMKSHKESSNEFVILQNNHLITIESLDTSFVFNYYYHDKAGPIIQSVEGEGKVMLSRHISSKNMVVSIVKVSHTSYKLVVYKIENLKLEEVSSYMFEDHDEPVEIQHLIQSDKSVLGILTKTGQFALYDIDDVKVTHQVVLPNDCIYNCFIFVNSPHRIFVGTSSGTFKVDLIDLYKNSSEEDLSKEKEIVMPDLDTLSLDTLKSFNKFAMEPLPLDSFPPPGVRQVYPELLGKDNTFSKWIIPNHSTSSSSMSYRFELELLKTRRIDTLDVELRMSRSNSNTDDSHTKYYLSIDYFCPETKQWKIAVNSYDMSGIIKSADNQNDPRLRLGSINLPDVFAKKLVLKLRSTGPTSLSVKQKRKMFSRKFTYNSDFDENGVLYWLGTNEGKDEYSNPVDIGKLEIELSHPKLFSPEMKKSDVIDRKANQSTYWGGSTPQWFKIDLGSEHRLLAEHYTLRHGYQHANSFIQNWCLQGSNDEEDWVTLHEGDNTPFTCGFDTKSFAVKDGVEHFRYFRVMQRGNYSMGQGKTGGSAYICIAGFEIYGELFTGTSSPAAPNYIQEFGVKLCGLKPSPGLTLKQTRLRRKAIAESRELHEKLFEKCCDGETSLEFRHACLDLLIDIWRWQVLQIPEIEPKKLFDFIYWNIIKADKITSSKAGRLTMFGTSPHQMKKVLFDHVEKFLTLSAQDLQSKSGFKQLLSLIASCWNVNKKASAQKSLDFLLQIGSSLYESRTPFYNILRTHYGLYGYPLELDIFGLPSTSEIKEKKTLSSKADKRRLLESKSKLTLENKKELEQQLIVLSHDFAMKRRALTTLLEQISISGESYAKHHMEVSRAYEACINAQAAHHKVKKKLHLFNTNEAKYVNDDIKLSRLTFIAEKLSSLLNQNYQGDLDLSDDTLSRLFLYFCVFGTPTLRREMTRFLMNHLTTHIPFPSLMLKKFFSRRTDFSRPINLFPLQDVFECLQEIMSQDHVRFFYVDDLFKLLEETTSYDDTGTIDVPLVSWILLMLSNIMSKSKNESPVHKGSKCRNCNMSPISGIRYRCVNCLDYDLCEQCEEEESHNKKHIFLKIPSPLPLPPSIRGLNPPKDPLLPLSYPSHTSIETLPATVDNSDVHYVLCDGCGKKNIKGIRYKCVHCDEFNLCEACEGKVEHYHLHLFLKIRNPLPPPSVYHNPKALIPVLLHIGFYPSAQYKNAPLDRSSKMSRSLADATKFKEDMEMNGLPLSKHSLRSSFADFSELLLDESDDSSSDSDSSSSDLDLSDVFERNFIHSKSTDNAVFDGKHLSSIFSVLLLSAKSQNLGPELFLLAIRVIEGLTTQYTPDDIWEDIFRNPSFQEFLELVSSYPSSFIRSAVVQMVDKLTNTKSYILGREGTYTLQLIKAYIRNIVVNLTNEIELFSNFLLELLLVTVDEYEKMEIAPRISGDENISGVSRRRPRRMSTLKAYIDDEDYPLDPIAGFLLNYLYEEEPIVSSSAARTWCIAFRALLYADPKQVVQISTLFEVVQEAITASEDIQVLFAEDFVNLLKALLSLSNSPQFQSNILKQIISTFSDVIFEGNTLILSNLLAALGDNLDPSFPFEYESFYKLLEELATLLPDTLPAYSKDETQNRLLKQMIDFLCTVFRMPTFPDDLLSNFIKSAIQKEDSFSYLFVSWLSRLDPKPKSKQKQPLNPVSSSYTLPWKIGLMQNEKKALLDENKNLHTTMSDLGISILQLIKIISTDDERAKHFLELSLNILTEKPNSVVVAELVSNLTKNETLSYYFLVEIGGFAFIEHQIKNANPQIRSSFSAPAFATMLSVAENQSLVQPHISGIRPQVKKLTKNLENLSHVSGLISPRNDKQLEKLLKENTASNNVPWTYNYKQNEKLTIEIIVPDNVILREIRMDCVSNYNTNSRFPSAVMIETGTSLKRYLPVGRFNCKLDYKYQASPNSRQTATFKFPLPEIEVVKFVRMHILAPKKSTWIAISKIQLLGHSSLLYTKGDNEDPLLMDGLPLRTNLEILDQTMRYDKVKSYLAKKKTTRQFALSLLQVLSPKTSVIVQNLIIHLTKYDVALSDMLLDHLLEGQSICHTDLTGMLCSLEDAKTKDRLNRLSDLVFRELQNHTSSSLSSHLIPFLDALSNAVITNRARNIYCDVSFENINRLFDCAVSSIDGSLIQQSSLLLLSSLIQSHISYYQYILSRYTDIFSSPELAEILSGSDKVLQKTFSLIGILSSSSAESSQVLLVEEHVLKNLLTILKSSTYQVVIERCLSFFKSISYDRKVKAWIGDRLFPILFDICMIKNLPPSIFYIVVDIFRNCVNMHRENQKKVAEYFLKLTQSKDLPEFILQLIVDIFSTEDKVIVCLRPKNGIVNETGILIPGQNNNDMIKFNPNNCHQNLDLDMDFLGVTANGNALTGWRTAISEKPIISGVRKWEVVLEKASPTTNIMIGVCEKNHKLNAYIGQNHSGKGWSYYGATTGYTYHDGKSDSHYGQKMQQGDIIGVCLDTIDGTLSYTRNGEDLGIAFKGLSGKELYPAVSLYDVGDRVRIQEVEGLSIDNQPLSYSRLEPNFPLQYQRDHPLFSLLSVLTLREIISHIFPSRKENIAFSLSNNADSPRIDLDTKLCDLYNVVSLGSEIVDLYFEINPEDEVPVQAIETTTVSSDSVFKYFAGQGGIPQLIDRLDTVVGNMQDEERKATASFAIPNELKEGIIALPIENMLTKTHISVWISWIRLLRMLLHIKGFIEVFIDHKDCKNLLFYVMTTMKMDIHKSDSSSRITTQVNAPNQNIQPVSSEPLKLSDHIISSPFTPLLDLLFDYIANQKSLDPFELRNLVYQSGVLHFLLCSLILLNDSNSKKVSNEMFATILNQVEENKKTLKKPVTQPTIPQEQKYWAKGTGYGTVADQVSATNWSHETYVKEQAEIAQKISTILKGIYVFLNIDVSSCDSTQLKLLQPSYLLVSESNLLSVLENHLRNDSILDMGRHLTLYMYVFKVTTSLFCHKYLLSFLNIDTSEFNIYNLIKNLNTTADIILKKVPKRVKISDEFGSKDIEIEDEVKLSLEIKATFKAITTYKEMVEKETNASKDVKADIEDEYISALMPHQFGEYDMSCSNGEYVHHFKSRIKTDKSTNKKKMKRLVQEISSLSSGLPLFKESSVFLRVDSERIDVMQCIITGPEDTPYAHGCFQFDIYCPPDYPTSPPAINLQTTGHGTVRFNPNLYNCGKVCLSLLGTWRGGPNEKWNENTTTLLQVFVSIQSLIFVEDPYFNEPGYESTMNTPKGEQQSRLYNENVKLATIRWAMIEQLKNPSPGFEEAILTHFRLKGVAILKDIYKWVLEVKESGVQELYQKVLNSYTELKKEIQALTPNSPLPVNDIENITL